MWWLVHMSLLASALTPLKVQEAPYPGSVYTGCIFSHFHPETIEPGVIHVDFSLQWEQFIYPQPIFVLRDVSQKNADFISVPEAEFKEDASSLTGFVASVAGKNLILRIPDADHCSYRIDRASTTIFLQNEYIQQDCQLGAQITLEVEETSQGSTEEPDWDPLYDQFIDSETISFANADDAVHLMAYRIPQTVTQVTLVNAVYAFVIHDYKSLWDNMSTEDKQKFRSHYYKHYYKHRRAFLIVNKFAEGDLRDREVEIEAVSAACDYLNRYATVKRDYRSISVSTFMSRWKRTRTDRIADFPSSVKGISLIDGLHDFARYNYRARFSHYSREKKKRHRTAYKTMVLVYNHIKKLNPGKDLSQRPQAEAAAQVSIPSLQMTKRRWIIEPLPSQHFTTNTIG